VDLTECFMFNFLYFMFMISISCCKSRRLENPNRFDIIITLDAFMKYTQYMLDFLLLL